MARRRTPRPERIPMSFILSDEITEVAALVFAKHGVHFDALRPLKIGYVMIGGGSPPKRDRIDGVWARFIKSPPIWRSISGFSALVWVREPVWRILSADQREALIAHELSHGTTNDRGELVVAHHDLEEFAWVARQYGPWSDGIRLFGQQLSLFGTPDGEAPGERRPNGKRSEEAPPPAKDSEGVVDLATHARRTREGRAPAVHP